MLKLAHLINPVAVKPQSDLYAAQPITFAAMQAAQTFARGQVEVELLTTGYPEDAPLLSPPGFRATPHLERSVLDRGQFQASRKMPLLADVLERLYSASLDADYLIFSNVDITPLPHFYTFIAWAVAQGNDALIINRRTLPKGDFTPQDLPDLYTRLGKIHPGFDCFVFPRAVYPRYFLGDICIGFPLIGRAMAVNVFCQATRFVEVQDQHLTFHIGDDQSGKVTRYADYIDHNLREFRAVCRHYDLFRRPPEAAFIRRNMLKYDPDNPYWVLRRALGGRLRQALRGRRGG